MNMRKELLEQYEKDLICRIACLASGVGDTLSGYLAEHVASLSDFLNITEDDLKSLKNGKGRQIFNDDKVKGILQVANDHSALKDLPICEAWIFFLAQRFIRNQIKSLLAFKFEHLDINPLLAKALHLKTPEDIIRFNVYQSVTRSAVTSWGMTVEEILRYSGCELDEIKVGQKGRKADLKKVKDGKDYYLQIKSGPNTMNVDMIESLNKVIEEIEKAGAKAFLGMTYGTRDRISAQILGNLKDVESNTKIGRELWDFISESEDYHLKVISVLDNATQHEMEFSFTDLLDKKISEFNEKWKKIHENKDINVALEGYI